MFDVRITTHWRKSTVRPWRSVSRPSSKSWRKTFQKLRCAFSNSSSSTTENGLARTDEISVAASPCELESASRRSMLSSVWNSLMSSRTRRSGEPKRNSASAFASSVLPVPVGPTNRKTPSGRVGSVSFALISAIRSTEAVDGLRLAEHTAGEELRGPRRGRAASPGRRRGAAARLPPRASRGPAGRESAASRAHAFATRRLQQAEEAGRSGDAREVVLRRGPARRPIVTSSMSAPTRSRQSCATAIDSSAAERLQPECLEQRGHARPLLHEQLVRARLELADDGELACLHERAAARRAAHAGCACAARPTACPRRRE